MTPFLEEPTGVAVDSTFNAYYWLIDSLQTGGYPAHMVDTLVVPQYAGLKHGDDIPLRAGRTDAIGPAALRAPLPTRAAPAA